MTAPRRVTASVLADLELVISSDDRALLETLYRVRLATGLQLQHLHHGKDNPAAQRRVRQLRRLSREGFVIRLERRIGGHLHGSRASVYALDIAGLRLVDPTRSARRPWTTSSPFVAHALAVTQIYVDLTLAARISQLDLISFDAEPRCWRRFTDRHGDLVVLKPDADVTVGVGDFEQHAFVEVDLATESRPRIRAKSQRYLDYYATGKEADRRGVHPRVLWVTSTEDRRSVLIDALSPFERTAPGVFDTGLLSTAVSLIAGGELR